MKTKKTEQKQEEAAHELALQRLSTKGKPPRAHVLQDALQEVTFSWTFRRNTMSDEVWFNGKPMTDEDLFEIEMELDRSKTWSPSRTGITSAVKSLAAQDPFSPVVEYLKGLKWDGVDRISKLAMDILDCGVLSKEQEALRTKMLTCFLVGAVARAQEPGCKMDSALIFQQPAAQGARKSTFFRMLAGEAWFSDSTIDTSNIMAASMITSGKWIVEWSELESAKRARDVGQIKGYITSQTDRFNAKYAVFAKEKPRSFVLCGTTNEEEFLSDPSGNRRFHYIKVGAHIDINKLKDQRDQIWAQALNIYNSGLHCSACKDRDRCPQHNWFLSDVEETLLKVQQQAVLVGDHWAGKIYAWMMNPVDSTKTIVPRTVSNILLYALGIEEKHQGKSEAIRVGNAIHKLGGWRKVDGTHEKRYVAMESPEADFQLYKT